MIPYISVNFAQEKVGNINSKFENGLIEEVKDKNRVYVLAYKTYQAENIVKSLKKYQIIHLVNNPNDADYIVVYDVQRIDFNKTILTAAGVPPSTEDAKYFGHLYVIVPLKSKKSRIIWDKQQRYLDSPRIDTAKAEITWYESIEKS